MTHRIDADNLHLHYGDVHAVDGLSMHIDGGRIYGLLGRNGSGKSSLLSLIAAFRKPTSGEVRIGGEPVFENATMMRQICLIRESGDTVDGSDSVNEALAFAGRMRPTWDKAYADQLAERFELPRRKHISKLSRGKRSALGIVLGLASRAPVTMFDESYLGMDAPSRYLFYDELLADFMANPRTILISTHLIEEVSSLFEEVLIIERGKLILHDDTEALRSRGATVTGPQETVDRYVDGLTVLGTRQLGRTKSATVYGDFGPERTRQAEAAGLEVGTVALQDLFVHLTGQKGDAHDDAA